MRKIILSAALAAALVGCSSSSDTSSSSGSTSTGTTTSSSGTTTGSSSSSSSSTTTTGGSTGVSGSGSGSTGTTTAGSGSTGGSTGGFCAPSGGSGSTGGDFSCLGAVTPPAGSGPFTLTVTLSDAVSGNTKYEGVPAKLCRSFDLNCASPDATGVSDSSGVVTLTASIPEDAGNYNGYLQLDPTDAGGGISTLPQLVFAPAFAGDQSLPLAVVSTDDVGTLGIFLGNLDTAQAQVIGNVGDCNGNNADGVVVGSSATDADGGSGTFYFKNGFPNGTATSTDATGNFVITNIPAGTPSISAALASDCTPIATVPVITRAGTITSVIVTPQ